MSGVNGGKPPDPPPLKHSEEILNEDTDMEISTDQEVKVNKNNSQIDQNAHVSNSIFSNIPKESQGTKENSTTVNADKDRAIKTRPEFLYGKFDLGPFHIYIENNLVQFKGKLNALRIGDIILSTFPELDNLIVSIDSSIDSIGRNRIRIKLKDYKSANFLIKNKNLTYS